MIIDVHSVYSFTEKGRRAENEDYIYTHTPKVPSASAHLYIICDGVGGAAKGAEASRLVSGVIAKALAHMERVKPRAIARAIQLAEAELDAYIDSHPEAKGMATTLSMLILHEDGAMVIQTGDSRVYHFRNGKIVFRTTDHSLVGELLAQNLISSEEARTHPQRNVITRAVMGSHKPALADITTLTDLQADDYFFLCTDGVWECASDQRLSSMLQDNGPSDEEKLNGIKAWCQRKSTDNYSAILLRLKNIRTNGPQPLSFRGINRMGGLRKKVGEWIQSLREASQGMIESGPEKEQG